MSVPRCLSATSVPQGDTVFKSIVRTLAAFCLLWSVGANASTVRVQEECGFGFDPCGNGMFTLATGDEPVAFYESDLGSVFELTFTGEAVVMTALLDNHVYENMPFGLDVYRSTGAIVPPNYDCVENCKTSTSIGFLPMSYFPSMAGEQVTFRLAVPEPATQGLMLAGVMLLWGWRRRRTH